MVVASSCGHPEVMSVIKMLTGAFMLQQSIDCVPPQTCDSGSQETEAPDHVPGPLWPLTQRTCLDGEFFPVRSQEPCILHLSQEQPWLPACIFEQTCLRSGDH